MAHRPDRTSRKQRPDAITHDIIDADTGDVIQPGFTDRRKALTARDALSQRPEYDTRKLKVVPHIPDAAKPHRPPLGNFRQMGDRDHHPQQLT